MDMMSRQSVLVVEDEEDIMEVIRFNLEKEGYEVNQALSGEKALQVIENNLPSLVLLDLMLPGINGLDLCRIFKQNDRTKAIPVIMLTAKSEDADIVAGLEMGAEDYITKPFSPRVLVARVRTILRRRESGVKDDSSVIQVEGMQIHPGRHEVTMGDNVVDLTPSEFRILHYLARRPGWVYSRDQIIDAIRGHGYVVTDRAIDVQVVGLRKKLGDYGKLIETVRGIGYRFRDRR
jgi:two-component system alkaline phosphatase synthesis response regulator PhoP|tara:strand:+ start:463 stop:1164 length:702 start_codon:yes stop_codon:yes gene_type:complete